ncbi:hypothetical protein AAMO2058_001587200 [Amorphochlora amoebiformis]
MLFQARLAISTIGILLLTSSMRVDMSPRRASSPFSKRAGRPSHISDAEERQARTRMLLELSARANNTCTVCHKRFTGHTGILLLARHVKIHIASKIFACAVCNKTFQQSDNLAQHSRIHTGYKPYRCTVCNRSFTQSGHLRSHTRIHKGHKPFQCNLCGQRYRHKVSLIAHTYKHKGIMPYNCSRCDNKFFQKSNLRTHMRSTHYNFNIYRCPICVKSFPSRSAMRQHVFCHAKKNTSRCPSCGRKFYRVHHFERHSKTCLNPNSRPYKCRWCPRAYYSDQHLSEHIATHRPDALFICNRCNRTFKFRIHHARHINSNSCFPQIFGNLSVSVTVKSNVTTTCASESSKGRKYQVRKLENQPVSHELQDLVERTRENLWNHTHIITGIPNKIPLSLVPTIPPRVVKSANVVSNATDLTDLAVMAMVFGNEIKKRFQSNASVDVPIISEVRPLLSTQPKSLRWEKRRKGRPPKIDVVDLAEAVSKGTPMTEIANAVAGLPVPDMVSGNSGF